MSEDDLAIPKGLSLKGRQAAQAILRVLKKHDMLWTGGCKAFYSPKEWKDRGEKYGTESELIVVYDGGCLTSFFYSYEPCPPLQEELEEELKKIGLYSEGCTHWYSAIYTV